MHGSVAFRKSAWKDVGGYPEWLETAEDTLFDLNLKKAGKKFVLAKDAVVRWGTRENAAERFSSSIIITQKVTARRCFL